MTPRELAIIRALTLSAVLIAILILTMGCTNLPTANEIDDATGNIDFPERYQGVCQVRRRDQAKAKGGARDEQDHHY